MRKLKYEPLAERLLRVPSSQHTVTLTFAEIEETIGSTLPKSARQYREWWNYERHPQPVQKVAWQGAGWVVHAVDLVTERVTFNPRQARQ